MATAEITVTVDASDADEVLREITMMLNEIGILGSVEHG